MVFLFVASLIWALSFGLIGNTLAGLPRAGIATMRLLLSLLIFLPFMKRIPFKRALNLFGIGAIQFGIMYLAYMYSFNYLKSHEVVLLTIFTPIYLSLINDIQERSFNWRNLLIATLAVSGSAVILYHNESRINSLTGFIFVQISGICFALGQLLYKRAFNHQEGHLPDKADHHVFAWLYAGGVAVILPLAVIEWLRESPQISTIQIWTIAYLGIVASGIAFFLWNKGARMVGAARLAVMNNLKIPLGALISLLVFKESANLRALLCGSALIGSAILITIAVGRHASSQEKSED